MRSPRDGFWTILADQQDQSTTSEYDEVHSAYYIHVSRVRLCILYVSVLYTKALCQLCESASAGSYVRVNNKNIPVTFINNVDPAFGVPLAPVAHQDSKGKVSLYEPKSFPFDSDDYDKNGLHEWVAHFLCLAIKVCILLWPVRLFHIGWSLTSFCHGVPLNLQCRASCICVVDAWQQH